MGLETNKAKSAGDRAKLKAEVDAQKADAKLKFQNAVDAQARARISFEEETHQDIDATNKNIDVAAEQMEKNAKKVEADIKSDTATILGKIAAAKKAAQT